MEIRFSTEFLEKFHVDRLLGAGGMGRVYLADHKQLGRKVAIKFLTLLDDSSAGQFTERFREEARVCSTLKHPNIVGVFESGTMDGLPYIVFEFVEGPDLAHEITKARVLASGRVIQIAAGVLAGLECAHAAGVIHRDIKPQNILVDAADGQPKIMDFGVSRADTGRSFKTQVGIILGTPAYMAPEVIRGGTPTVRADIYSLGCTLYECLAGRPPFLGPTEIAVLEQQLSGEAPPLESLAVGAPRGLLEVVTRAMSKKPEGRFPSARAMLDAVEAIRDGRPAPEGQHSSAPPHPQPGAVEPPLPRAQPAPRTTSKKKRLTGSSSSLSQIPRPLPGEVVEPTRVRVQGPDGRSLVRRLAPAAAALMAVLLCLALFGRKPQQHQIRGDSVESVQVRVSATGMLRMDWRTALQGQSEVKCLKAGAAGQGESPPARSPVASEDHWAEFTGLEAGTVYELTILDTRGEKGWSRTVAVPGKDLVHIHCPKGPNVPVFISVPAVTQAGTRLILFEMGAKRVLDAPAPGSDQRITFPDTAKFTQLGSGTTVEVEIEPGVIAEYPVDPVRALAAGLADSLKKLSVDSIVGHVVPEMAKRSRRSSSRERTTSSALDPTGEPIFHTYDAPQLIDGGGIFSDGTAPPTLAQRRSTRLRLASDGAFKRKLLRELVSLSVAHDLELFRDFAAVFYASRDRMDDLQLKLYDGLTRLRLLDLLITSQLDDDNLGIQAMYRGLVEVDHGLDLREGPPARPPGEALFESGTCWTVGNFVPGWDPSLGPEHDIIRATLGRPYTGGSRGLSAVYRGVRSTRPIDGLRYRSGLVRLSAAVAMLSPNYFLQVEFPQLAGQAQPFRILLTHPSNSTWCQAMEDLSAEGALLSRQTPRKIAWGMIQAKFPSYLLRREAVSLKVSYHHIPGRKPEELAAIPHNCYLAWLAIDSDQGGGAGSSPR